MKDYTVYWYKRPQQTNPYTEGYIGITNDMYRRDKEHRRNKKFSHFTNALKVYDDIEYEILHSDISLDEASILEEAYRPTTNTGWNSARGGADVLGTPTVPIALYHESDPDNIRYFESSTQASKELDISLGRISQAKYRGNQIYGYDGWALLLDETMDRNTTKTISEIASERTLGAKRTKPSPLKGVARWSDEDKKRISKQHKGKTISEKQKETVRKKNRHNKHCKEVTLVHSSDESVLYTYHSVSEASRQLGIPLSRLKSKAQRPLNRYGKDGWKITNLGSE